MKRILQKKYLIISAFVLITGMALNFGLSTGFQQSAAHETGAWERKTRSMPNSIHNQEDGSGGYRLSFDLDNAPTGIINCYMVKYRTENLDLGWKYAKMFTDIVGYQEKKDQYEFWGSRGSVTMDKEIYQIQYTADGPLDTKKPLESDEEAIDRALAFIGNRLLMLFYEEAQVHFDGDVYRIQFINRVGNLKNYAFPNEVLLDRYGNVTDVTYYTLQYDRIGGCGIKSMRGAFDELPQLKDNEMVYLKSCQLVYIYKDSIVQPAYYFQGAASEDRSYECFVPAAIF